ncbi:RING/U-box [Glarea lozoyensis ATCC 20868]|uniref:RING/U-box n=1 Tax=Glarea lozoyensis (strain ATCC 20868 / MF5171) TaxID=1116229 RepID=S3CJM2_GLAL2|nr:RING/U-box [Glarea lozoyensis ATCC 20868]EPE25424.1 RING/U-box [Glarea lozoyensis ATCC 20868]
MCKVFFPQYTGCPSHHTHKDEVILCFCDKRGCPGVTKLFVPLTDHCEICLVKFKTPGAPNITNLLEPMFSGRRQTFQDLTPSMRKACQDIMAIAPQPHNGSVTNFLLRDKKTGAAHTFNVFTPWIDTISDSDFKFLHELKEALSLYYLEAMKCPTLAGFLNGVRVNGLKHEHIQDPPARVREERNSVLLARLARTVPEVTVGDELEDPNCTICREPLGKPEPVVKLPCGHLIGKHCLNEWIRKWDRDSALRVCTLCNEGVGLTELGDEPVGDTLAGFEPALPGTEPDSWQFKKMIEKAVEEACKRDVEPVPGPWWMTALKSAVS